MKVSRSTKISLIIILCTILLVVGYVNIAIYRYLQASQLKTVEDISPSEAIIIQEGFDINLPPEAKIISFGYVGREVVFRIEGVVDIEAFLTESLPLELDAEEAQSISDRILWNIDYAYNREKDIYNEEIWLESFYFSEYQSESRGLTSVRFYLVNGVLIVEISDTGYYRSDYRAYFRDIVNR